MPRMGSAIYAAHKASVIKLAARDGGVSRPQLMKELSVSRPVANGLVEKCELTLNRKEGRTEYFVTNGVTDSVPETETVAAAAAPEVKQSTPALVPEVKAVAVPKSDDTGSPDIVDKIAELDAQVMDTRNTLHAAAAKAGEALAEWGTNSAMVDALRARLAELAVERLRLSP